MKIFHLSDLHIGLKLINRDLSEDQEYILGQIVEAAKREQPDAAVIAGDIYDRAVPSAEAVALFDRFVSSLTGAVPDAEIMMISGNHDSAPRVNVFRQLLQKQKIHMIGLPPMREGEHIEKVTVPDAFGSVHFYLLPFVRPSMVRELTGSDENGNLLSYNAALHRLLEKETIDDKVRNVLVSHQFYLPVGSDPEKVERMDSEICTVGNIDVVYADVLEPFDYAALGHIHKAMQMGGGRFCYCGTPLACSVSEAGQQKGIRVVELAEKGSVNVTVLPLTPLREVKVLRGTLDEVMEEAGDDYVSVRLTETAKENAQNGLVGNEIQDRLRLAFPNLLEIRRETERTANYTALSGVEDMPDPFELCCAFLPDLDEEEKKLLENVINTVVTGKAETA